MVWLLVLSIFLAADTVEVKGTRGLYYRVFVNDDILYFQCKAKDNWFKPVALDSGDVASPSMAITIGDYLHIAWCKGSGVYYRINLEPITKNTLKSKIIPQWSAKIKISTHMPQTEPASELFIQTYGDTIFIDWYCPGEIGNSKEKWRRKKWILDPYYEWFPPVNYTLKNIESKLKR